MLIGGLLVTLPQASFAEQVCSDSSSADASGSLQDSGGSSANYDNSESCQFLIQPSTGGDISLVFSSFNYESGFDTVRVYDGTTTSASLLGSFTGTSLPANLTATSGAMLVLHSTDSSVTSSGFTATWSSGGTASVELCNDGSTTAETGTITDSGGSSGNYANDENCGLTIQPPSGGAVTLSFNSFNFESGWDYLRIYDGTSSSGTLLSSLTGSSLPADVTGTSGALYLVSDTDSSVVSSGFEAQWSTGTAEPDTCPAQNVADNFPNVSYAQNSGTENWSSDWLEIGESDGPSSGITRVNNSNCTSGNCLRIGQPGTASSWSNIGLQREVDLSTASNATLTFNYYTGRSSGSEDVVLAVSDDGGSSWTTLRSYSITSTNFSATAQSFDLSSYTNANTQIRFLSSGTNAVIGMYIDDIQIQYDVTCPPVEQELSRWKFDETTGSSAIDSISGNDGSYARAETGTVVGPCGESIVAARFDGVSDYVEIPHVSDYLLNDGVVEFWVRPDDVSGTQDLFSKDSSDFDTGGHLTISLAGDDVSVRLQSTSANTVLSASNVATAGAWLHINFAWGAAGARLYINGSLLDDDSYTGGLGTSSGGLGNFEPIAVGAGSISSGNNTVSPTSNYFAGMISDLRLFSGDLSETDIASHSMCTTTPPNDSIANWQLDETSGTQAADSASVNNGEYRNGVTLATEGVCGSGSLAASFDGSNDYVEIPHSDDYLLDSGSLSLWFAADNVAGGRQGLFSKDSSGYDSGGHITLYIDGDDVGLRLQSTSSNYTLIASNTVQAQQWQNVVVVWGSGGVRLYVDGVLRDTNSYTGGLGTTSGGSGNAEPIALAADTGGSGDGTTTSLRGYFNGQLSDVQIYDRELSAHEVRAIDPCAVGVTQLALVHDGFGIHCAQESIAVTAVSGAGSVVSGYIGQVTLDTQTGLGTWSLVDGDGTFNDTTSNDGLAVYSFTNTDNGYAEFALEYTQDNTPLDVDAYLTSDPTVRDLDNEGSLQFAPNGFTLTANALSQPLSPPISDPLSTQLSARPFAVHLAAYGQTPDDPVCGVIETYAGSRRLAFWNDYVDPTTGSLQPTVNGTATGTDRTSAVSQNIDFVAGQARIEVRYDDAGQIQLNTTDETSFSEQINGGSNTFVVQPAAITISGVRTSTGVLNPEAASASGTGFVAAGEPFTVTIEAVNQDGNRTPNFGREQSPESLIVRSAGLVLPIGGRHGSSDGVLFGDQFVATTTPGQFVNTSVVFDEIGIIQLQASLADGDYLGSGALTAPLSANVGRFYPASFVLTNQTLTASCGTFSYQGQPELSATFTVEARNLAGSLVQNYDRVLLGSANVAGIVWTAENADAGVDLGNRLSSIGASWTAGQLQLNTTSLVFSRSTSPDGPFDNLQLGLTLIDPVDSAMLAGVDQNAGTTGSCVSASNCLSQSLGSPTQVRYGRLAVLPGSAPEDSVLDVALAAEYFDGSAFRAHTQDQCSSYASIDASLSAFTDNLSSGETTVVAPSPSSTLLNGVARPSSPLRLSAPGVGNAGGTALTLDVQSWLEFPWTGAGMVNPSAQQQFGTYRGHDRIVSWDEQTR